MPNKYNGDVTKDYLVEGAKSSGYLKGTKKGFGDDSTSIGNTNYSSGFETVSGGKDWTEGKKGDKTKTISFTNNQP